MTLLVLYVLLAICVSFLCSILEATLLTITPSSINRAKEKGLPWGDRMGKLKEDIDRPLSAILTLNTIAHTMGAAGAGAQYAQISGNKGEAIFAGALTLAILIFTEIIPKTIGARFANGLAPTTSIFLNFLVTALKPLVLASKSITGLIAPNATEPDHSEHREEILAMARIGHESGSLRERESQFVQNLMRTFVCIIVGLSGPKGFFIELNDLVGCTPINHGPQSPISNWQGLCPIGSRLIIPEHQ